MQMFTRTYTCACSLFTKSFSIAHRDRYKLALASFLMLGTLALVAALNGQQINFILNGSLFPNSSGASQTNSTIGKIDLTGPFFQVLGTNGRTCATCHQPSDGMSVSAVNVEQRFVQSKGEDPIFRTVDGSNCDHSVDVSSLNGKKAAYSLLRTRGLFRIAISVPANADYQVTSVNNQYGCNESDVISMYRRPLPGTNLRFLSAVMWDGRESSELAGTTKITFANYATSLRSDLAHQALDATKGHAQGDGTRPTPAEQQQLVDFEMSLFTAQAVARGGGSLSAQGAQGGPAPLLAQPFFIGKNSSVNFLLPQLEQPGGLLSAGDGKFSSAIFNVFDAWAKLPSGDPRAAIARGQAIFNSKPINITGVSGINDDASAGGLASGGISSLPGTCGTCHDTPNVGNHSFATALDIGTGTPSPGNLSLNLGGLDVSYLPNITVCRKDSSGSPTSDCKLTTDLGLGLIDGKFDHVGKIKGPVLRGLAARAPYFHNGSATRLLDVVQFYEKRFDLALTSQEESDLVAFLGAL
jgi:cytochrome c peroxidase